MSLLDQNAIERQLTALSKEWSVVGGVQLTLHTEWPSFLEVMKYVDKVAELAEQHNHHPTIEINYSTVDLTLSTHDLGGLSHKDFDLAKDIEAIRV